MDTQIDPKKLFVGGLSWETDEAKLEAYFIQFGPISAVEIKRDSEDRNDPTVKRHRGFGFVTFENAESVQHVLHQGHHILDNKKIDPKPAEVKPAMPRPLQAAMSMGGGDSHNNCEKKVFVGGVGNNTTPDDVSKYFASLGLTATDVEFKYDKVTQRMRGFGFVTFASVEQVDKACQNRYHEINGKSVEVKKAQPRHTTPSGQAYAQMRQLQASGSGYAAYSPYAQADYSRANGQQFQQPFYGSSQYYGYSTATPQAGYGQYANTGTNYGYDTSAYTRSQTSSGDRQDTQAYYQQHYGHSAQQLAAAAATYGQDAGSYTGRSGYTAGQESYGQQSGGYGRGTSQQQQSHYGAGASSYGH